MNLEYTNFQKLLSEFLGTLFLLLIVIGSGIMGESLASGNAAVALLANAIATGTGLYVLIHLFGPISGAHFNPIVSLYFHFSEKKKKKDTILFIIVQILGGILGVWLSHFLFELPILQTSLHIRTGMAQWISEIVATSGLLLTIVLGLRHNPLQVPALVGSYITAAYWFTSSTSFANPAVTIARTLSNTFAGIRPEDSLGFILSQILGLALSFFILTVLTKAGRSKSTTS
ncbi:aquaporin [Leptospira brenneri]|uniref:Aquaporin family protein n=1 Tax=Leptospira brenneri TaxID=2023182 RepID=A0A2M9Y5H4_9LEPT|nr:MIP/aquaporin family protein [Leptospira brenneri]PJZ46676.1 aquaporin family protein [Leptospira brenneri]TGK96790.1 aquaporin family protein [Leptospira brenneri]